MQINQKKFQKVKSFSKNTKFYSTGYTNNKVITTFNEVVNIQDIQGFELYQFSPNIYGCLICFNNNSDNIGKLWYNIKNIRLRKLFIFI